MKVWLDDQREAPEGWVRTKTAYETIELLKSGRVEALSLDHDLGEDEPVGTGYDVLLWLEKEVHMIGFTPPAIIKVHSANSAATPRMEQAIEQIKRYSKRDG